MIPEEAQEAKHFSLTVDSTPSDISHVDELAICVRYVNMDCAIVDRFLGFVGNASHRAAEMFDATMATLREFSIDIENCRGQSYDTASNIQYLQRKLWKKIRWHSILSLFRTLSQPCRRTRRVMLLRVGRLFLHCAATVQFFLSKY